MRESYSTDSIQIVSVIALQAIFHQARYCRRHTHQFRLQTTCPAEFNMRGEHFSGIKILCGRHGRPQPTPSQSTALEDNRHRESA